jgi:hypothetical protein
LVIDGPLVVDGRGIVIAVADQPFQFDAYRARRAGLEADAVYLLLGGVLRERRSLSRPGRLARS